MFWMTASEFWPNTEDIDQYHHSLTNARNMKRADRGEVKELSCLYTPCSCSVFSLALCQSRIPLEMRNAMTSVFWLEKTRSPLRHLEVTVSNHSLTSSGLHFVPGRRQKLLLLCQLQPAGVVALVRKGQLLRKLFGWFVILAQSLWPAAMVALHI